MSTKKDVFFGGPKREFFIDFYDPEQFLSHTCFPLVIVFKFDNLETLPHLPIFIDPDPNSCGENYCLILYFHLMCQQLSSVQNPYDIPLY